MAVSVCPAQAKVREVMGGGLRSGVGGFVAAIGQEFGHCGRKFVQLRRKACLAAFRLGFEVTDVTRPLVAVRRIIEKG